MITAKKLQSIKELAERGVGGERENAQAILDKLERDGKSEIKPHPVNFGLAVECAVDHWVELYGYYIGVGERIARDIIFSHTGVTEVDMNETNKSLCFIGTKDQYIAIQAEVDKKVGVIIRNMDAVYEGSCGGHQIKMRKLRRPKAKYAYAS